MGDSSMSMTRREFLKASLMGSGMLLGSPLVSFGGSGSESKRPPNFVIILIDDLGYQDIGCFGAPLIQTPRLDRMAAEGTKFTSFYVQPSCTPTRAALMTGCYPLRVGLPSVLSPTANKGIHSDEILLAELLKTRGYATACVGKWHLGWQRCFLPTQHGFDYYYGLPYSNDMSRKEKPVPLIRNEEIIEQPVYQATLTERYTREAMKFITQNKDRPFFLYLPHTMVHVPLHVSSRFRGKSKRGLYGDAVEGIDWSTGQILDTLAKLGLDKNTLVVFTSDNGPWLIMGEDGGSALPLRNGKSTTFEGGMRVPTIVRWHGHVPEGEACSELTTVMDLYPTIAKLAGAQIPTDRIIDGRDIWPLMAGVKGAKTPHEALFYYKVESLEAVRSGKWKLIFERPKEKVPMALYDLGADIGETTNVADAHPDVVQRLNALAERAREDLGDSSTGRVGKNCRPHATVE